MVYASLVLSVLLFVAANRIVARAEYTVPGVVLACLGFWLCPAGLMVYFPAVALQAGLLCALLLVLVVPRRGRRLYLPLSVVATLVAYGSLTWNAVEKQQEFAELRRQFPYESLEARLPTRPAQNVRLTNFEGLTRFEGEVEQATYDWRSSGRTAALRQIHEHSVDTFVNSAGFGVGRMTRRSDPKQLKEELPARPPVPQPDYLDPFVPPAIELLTAFGNRDAGKLARLHEDGVLDFVNPRGFGFARDRAHVAGFQKHGMTKVPEATPWAVARVELVGLVVHEQPVVYVSANLPQMDELRAAPTRPPDAFELEALEALRGGEELFAREAGDKGRMLGAIRSAKQCLGCHGGARGDLLGAFSYGLRR